MSDLENEIEKANQNNSDTTIEGEELSENAVFDTNTPKKLIPH